MTENLRLAAGQLVNTGHFLRETAAKVLEGEAGIVFAYLFGSATTDVFGARSDVDVAIMYDHEPAGFRSQLALHHKLAKSLGRDVDLVVLNSSRSLPLRRAIVRSGFPLVDRDPPRRLSYEVTVEHDYLDFKYSSEAANA
jgi:predicted nucleotidyltransferase